MGEGVIGHQEIDFGHEKLTPISHVFSAFQRELAKFLIRAAPGYEEHCQVAICPALGRGLLATEGDRIEG